MTLRTRALGPNFSLAHFIPHLRLGIFVVAFSLVTRLIHTCAVGRFDTELEMLKGRNGHGVGWMRQCVYAC